MLDTVAVDFLVLEATSQGNISPERIVDDVRARPIGAYLPIIVCSADQTFMQERAAALEQRGCRLLGKPLNRNIFLRAINESDVLHPLHTALASAHHA